MTNQKLIYLHLDQDVRGKSLNTGQDTARDPQDLKVVEPMAELARFAFDWAETLCDPDHGCFDYHRMWSMVRFLETGAMLPESEGFFDTEAPSVANDGVANVIISGGADTGVLTLVANAYLQAGITPVITMIDRCATPLHQCRLFAQKIGVEFHTIQGTIDQLDVPPADAIFAHSFLPFFPPAARPGLFRIWARNLRIGGKVIMSQRLVPPGGSYDKTFLPDEIAQRRDRLATAFNVQRPVNVSLEEFLNAAERLWTHRLSGRGVSEDDILALCQQSGLTVDKIVYDEQQGSLSPTAPKAAATRKRAGISLVRQP